MQKTKRLWDAYRFSGFTSERKVSGFFGDPKALVIKLRRRGKKRFAGLVAVRTGTFYDRKVRRVRDLSCGDRRIWLDVEIRSIMRS